MILYKSLSGVDYRELVMSDFVTNLKGEIRFLPALRKHYYPKYSYNFTAPQLCFLCQSLGETKSVAGTILEIGCARGETTIFLNNYMKNSGIDKRYYAIDTFSGFVKEDIEYEQKNRGKGNSYRSFRKNKKKWFDGTLQQNGINDVISVEADINTYDLSCHYPISFALLDVDLYRPMKKGLPKIYQGLASGGIIIVDDCDENDDRWDGSDQAYKEFMEELGQPIEIVFGKLGVIRK